MANITCNIEHSFDNIYGLRDEWDQLAFEEESGFYMSYDWCRIWWKHYGYDRKLLIFLFRSENETVGIIPMFIDRVCLGPVWLRIAKMVGSDFTIKICNPLVKKKG